ncbi:IS630 transposase-related protein, partial [Nitrosomonas communis]
MAYSLDIRRKVLSVREKEGLTIAEVAARFDVGVASVTRWVKNIHRKPQG